MQRPILARLVRDESVLAMMNGNTIQKFARMSVERATAHVTTRVLSRAHVCCGRSHSTIICAQAVVQLADDNCKPKQTTQVTQAERSRGQHRARVLMQERTRASINQQHILVIRV